MAILCASILDTTPWKDKPNVKEGSKVAATYVSWTDAVEFCKRLSVREGKNYRLPAEAEWEFSCRGGTSTVFSFGANEASLSEYGWWGGSSGDGNTKSEPYPHEVGLKRSNQLGLFDMHGNVWEWCSDWAGAYPPGHVSDPLGPSQGSSHVDRGGGWSEPALRCRSAIRSACGPNFRIDYLGFRVAAGLPNELYSIAKNAIPEERKANEPQPALQNAIPSDGETQMHGQTSPELVRIDDSIKEFMQTHNIPGAALAIGRGAKLLYAKGFGVQQKGTNEQVKVDSLFRIAEVSQPITGIAVMQLLQQNKFKLKDSITSLLGLREPNDPRWKKITVEHLLRHTAGFNCEKSFDPMYRFSEIAKARGVAYPIAHQDLIEYMLDQPLDHEPGNRFAFSNFGYCLLGRLIEKSSGLKYAEYVQQAIWQPLSISDAHIGK